MADITIEQAIFRGRGELLARSSGFRDDWLLEAERICTGFGVRPAGVACAGAVFAQQFGREHVAVVQVTDLGSTNDPPGFRALIFPRLIYQYHLADPFLIADRFPPPWNARGQLPVLAWPEEPLPPRTVSEVQQALKTGDSPTLLGSVQALVDGGRVVFQRPASDPELLRKLWMLLPTSTRGEIWPASFAFGNDLGFHVLVVPAVEEGVYDRYVKEAEAGDYPAGPYETSLQVAAEAGDQRELDVLFARRSGRQMMRLLILILVLFVILALAMRFLFGPRPAPRPAGWWQSETRMAALILSSPHDHAYLLAEEPAKA